VWEIAARADAGSRRALKFHGYAERPDVLAVALAARRHSRRHDANKWIKAAWIAQVVRGLTCAATETQGGAS
jgi:hypothetical protein